MRIRCIQGTEGAPIRVVGSTCGHEIVLGRIVEVTEDVAAWLVVHGMAELVADVSTPGVDVVEEKRSGSPEGVAPLVEDKPRKRGRR